MKVKTYGKFNLPTGSCEITLNTSEEELKKILEKHPAMSRFIEDDNNTKRSTEPDTSKPKSRKGRKSGGKSNAK